MQSVGFENTTLVEKELEYGDRTSPEDPARSGQGNVISDPAHDKLADRDEPLKPDALSLPELQDRTCPACGFCSWPATISPYVDNSACLTVRMKTPARPADRGEFATDIARGDRVPSTWANLPPYARYANIRSARILLWCATDLEIEWLGLLLENRAFAVTSRLPGCEDTPSLTGEIRLATVLTTGIPQAPRQQ